jgi:hypothetical protein
LKKTYILIDKPSIRSIRLFNAASHVGEFVVYKRPSVKQIENRKDMVLNKFEKAKRDSWLVKQVKAFYTKMLQPKSTMFQILNFFHRINVDFKTEASEEDKVLTGALKGLIGSFQQDNFNTLVEPASPFYIGIEKNLYFVRYRVYCPSPLKAPSRVRESFVVLLILFRVPHNRLFHVSGMTCGDVLKVFTK